MYLVAFDGEQAEWRLERDVLIAALRRDRDQLAVKEPRDELRDVVWSLDHEGLYEAYANSDGTCLYVDGPLAHAVRWALWYRRLIPDVIDLVLCDDEYSFVVPLAAGASMPGLLRMISASR